MYYNEMVNQTFFHLQKDEEVMSALPAASSYPQPGQIIEKSHKNKGRLS